MSEHSARISVPFRKGRIVFESADPIVGEHEPLPFVTVDRKPIAELAPGETIELETHGQMPFAISRLDVSTADEGLVLESLIIGARVQAVSADPAALSDYARLWRPTEGAALLLPGMTARLCIRNPSRVATSRVRAQLVGHALVGMDPGNLNAVRVTTYDGEGQETGSVVLPPFLALEAIENIASAGALRDGAPPWMPPYRRRGRGVIG